jgi:ABC-2 type transport system permease protein
VVDIVVFANDPSDFSSETVVLYRQKHRLVNGENELVIRLDGSFNDGSQPAYVGVDPFVRFIGTDVKDNVLRIKTKAEE